MTNDTRTTHNTTSPWQLGGTVFEPFDVTEEIEYDPEATWQADADAISRGLPGADLRCEHAGCALPVTDFYFVPFDGRPDTTIEARCDRHALPNYYVERAKLESDPLARLMHLDRGHEPSSPRLVAYLRERGAV